jgi:hypothetical protein
MRHGHWESTFFCYFQREIVLSNTPTGALKCKLWNSRQIGAFVIFDSACAHVTDEI